MNVKQLQSENERLVQRLQEAEDTIAAIRNGGVDAFVVQEGQEPRVFTLETADRPYRILVENMQQAAVTVNGDGVVSYCNGRLSEWLQVTPEKVMGAPLSNFVAAADRDDLKALLRDAAKGIAQGDIHLQRADATLMPAYLTIHSLPTSGAALLCVLITDLTAARFEQERERACESSTHRSLLWIRRTYSTRARL